MRAAGGPYAVWMGNNIVSCAAIAAQAGAPVLIWGPPGVGKTLSIVGLGGQLKLPVEVVIASIREPADFAGLPVVQNGRVTMAPPRWAKRLVEEGKGILFLDEISTAPPAVQAALLRVVFDRVVGDIFLPEGVAIIAAANPPEQAAGGWDLSAPLANRFVHLYWRLNASDWVDGIVGGWSHLHIPQLPENWKSGVRAARAVVGSFIRHRPDLLLRLPEEEAQAGKAWPSPRTWEMAARLLAACEAVGADDLVRIELLAGAVGEAAAGEFESWRSNLDLQDPEHLLRAPETYRHPERADQVYATLAGVVAAVAAKPTQDRWVAAWAVIANAVRAGAPDVAAAAARSLVGTRKASWGIPLEEVRSLVPVLRAAGIIAS